MIRHVDKYKFWLISVDLTALLGYNNQYETNKQNPKRK